MASLLALYVLLVSVLIGYARRHPEVISVRDAVGLLADLLRLIRRLAADKSLPRTVRIRLTLLLAYLVSPIDLIPDFVPILGYVDDAVIVALVLRSTVRAAGPDAVASHWPGSQPGLALVKRLAGISEDL